MKALLILLITSNSFAYFLDNPKVSSYSHRRYIRPQARSIIQDYDTLFRLFEGKLASSYELNKDLTKAFKSILKLKEHCPLYLSTSCIESINEITNQSILFEKGFTQFQQSLICDQANIETCLSQISKSGQIQTETLKFLAELEQVSLLVDKKPNQFLSEELIKKFQHIQYLFNVFQIGLLESKYQDVFLKAYLFYIRPMGLWYKTNSSDRAFIVKNIENFNKTWNEFNFYISKKLEKETPKSVRILVKTMHNRWNSILRIILRQN